MKNLSKTIFGVLALLGVSTSVAFAGDTVVNENMQEEGIIHQTITVENGVVTGSSNYFITSNDTVFMYVTDDGVNYNVSEGNLEEILTQIENGTFDMSKPFAIFESDYTKDLYLLVWDGTNLTQYSMSDIAEHTELLVFSNNETI